MPHFCRISTQNGHTRLSGPTSLTEYQSTSPPSPSQRFLRDEWHNTRFTLDLVRQFVVSLSDSLLLKMANMKTIYETITYLCQGAVYVTGILKSPNMLLINVSRKRVFFLPATWRGSGLLLKKRFTKAPPTPQAKKMTNNPPSQRSCQGNTLPPAHLSGAPL